MERFEPIPSTDPLEEDLGVAGPVSPHLFVATFGTDADWVVMLIHVHPPRTDALRQPRVARRTMRTSARQP